MFISRSFACDLHIGAARGALVGCVDFSVEGKERERNKWFAPLLPPTAARIVNVAVAHEVDHVTTPSLSLDIGDVIIDHLSLSLLYVDFTIFFSCLQFHLQVNKNVLLVESLTWAQVW